MASSSYGCAVVLGLLLLLVVDTAAEDGRMGRKVAPKQSRKGELQTTSVSGEIEVGGLKRTYLLHTPPGLRKDEAVPLVLVFHGGSGTGEGMEKLTRFSALADREKLVVVYPDGIGKNWNDGRVVPTSKAHREKIDDLAFVSALLDTLGKDQSIDPKRIFATGVSNGGIFSHYLAANLAPRIAAIAPVVGGIADPFFKRFHPDRPVSVFIVQGTKDPVVPYEAGWVARNRGKIIATEEAVNLWVRHNGCDAKPATGTLADKDPKDGCIVQWSRWSKGRDKTEVLLYKIDGGGHTWPGGPQYLPVSVIGKVCRDFDATQTIFEFFKDHPRP
jgi:polyhydroxybutyrate depolymerase